MNFLAKIDLAIILGYQTVLNRTELKVKTAVNIAIYLFVSAIFAKVCYAWIYTATVDYGSMMLLTLFLFLPPNNSADATKILYKFYMVYRIGVLAFAFYEIIYDIMKDYDSIKRLIGIYYEITFVSIWYFSACEDPPPRKKTQNIWKGQTA